METKNTIRRSELVSESSASSQQMGRSWNKFRMTKSYHGFTLVELIVVITILVILGTIAFINLGNFAGSARDSARISNLTNLQKWLALFQIKAGTYPMPEWAVAITASGTPIGYQGFAKEQTESIAKLSVGATKDPLDPTIYTTYSVNANQTKMQLMNFLEDGGSVTALTPPNLPLSGEEYAYLPLMRGIKGVFEPSTAYASTSSDYSKRTPTLRGDTLGILLGNGSGGTLLNQPVQETTMTGMDLVKTTTLSWYTMVFSKSDTTASVVTSGTGAYTGSLFTFAYNKRDDLLVNKTLAGNDPSLVGWWDMETTTLSGSQVLLKDLSGYGNNWVWSDSVALWWVDGNGKSGKATSFSSGSANYIEINSNWLSATKTFTIQFIGKGNFRFEFGINTYWPTIWFRPNSINFHDGIGWKVSPLFSILDNSNWHNFCWIYDGQNIMVYRDGIKISTISASGTVNNNITKLLISGQMWAGFVSNIGFPGSIDEVRIYNRALSDSEITALYNATK